MAKLAEPNPTSLLVRMKKNYWLLLIPLMAAGYFFLRPIKNGLLPADKNERPFEEREEDGPAEALKQEILMARDPLLGYVPTERLLQYKEFMRRHPELRAGSSGSNNKITDGSGGRCGCFGGSGGLNWMERGPNNIGGRCRAIIVDQNDPTGNTVLVGSVSGGLWRTTNFTAASPTWTQQQHRNCQPGYYRVSTRPLHSHDYVRRYRARISKHRRNPWPGNLQEHRRRHNVESPAFYHDRWGQPE